MEGRFLWARNFSFSLAQEIIFLLDADDVVREGNAAKSVKLKESLGGSQHRFVPGRRWLTTGN